MVSLEQIVRPAQATAPSGHFPTARKASLPVTLVILAGQGVKSFIGAATLNTTVYNIKYPKEQVE
jgi:hypothetical protein